MSGRSVIIPRVMLAIAGIWLLLGGIKDTGISMATYLFIMVPVGTVALLIAIAGMRE